MAKALALFLLASITFSFSLLNGQSPQRNRSVPSEITFLGKEETRWAEKRDIPLPVIIGQGVKEEPAVGSFDLGNDRIGPMTKMSPSITQPGCSYTNRFTRGFARVVAGDKAFYERGKYQYFEGNYEDAIQTFQKLIQEYPDSPWKEYAFYWMGEARFHQGRMDEAFSYFEKAAVEYIGNEYYAHALYACGWIQFRKGAFEEGHRFFHRVYEKSPDHSITQSCLFWSAYCLYHLGRHAEAIRELETLAQRYPSGIWRPEAEYLMGVNEFRLKKFNEAASLFKGFLKMFPHHPLEESARYALGWSLISLGDYAEGR